MRIFQGLGSLSEVLSKAKKLLLRERRETFRVRMSAATYRAVCRNHAHEDRFDEAVIPHVVERAKNCSHLTPDRENIDTHPEPKKKEI
jgi:hypothetical protein